MEHLDEDEQSKTTSAWWVVVAIVVILMLVLFLAILYPQNYKYAEGPKTQDYGNKMLRKAARNTANQRSM